MKKTAAVSITVLYLLYSCVPVPLTGRRQLQLISRGEMLQLGAQSYNNYTEQHQTITGTPEAEMVERVGNNIRLAVEDYLQQQNDIGRLEGYQWQFTLFDDTTVNAWVMPGGRVGINSGILPVAQDETGLAVIMGHEIGHAVAEHANERMSQLLLIQLGGMVLSEALSEHPHITQQLALVAFGVGAQLGILLPYSRLHESEADHLGLIFMAMAGYDPRQAVPFWERMIEMRQVAEPPEFLSTHPSDQERINNIQTIIPEALEYYEN
ncbi:Peptidase M48 Ste24p [Chitinispirillum alkaliphilum]|nr:Peptidase M48 Ste24p [Chitinispirillum alkaliphilum]